EDCPSNNQDGLSYDDCDDNTQIGTLIWDDYIPMRNLGDGIQIRTPNAEQRHGVFWQIGANDKEDTEESLIVSINGISAAGTSIWYSGLGSWFDASKYSVSYSSQGTPGEYNSSENYIALTSLITNGYEEFDAGCSVGTEDANGQYSVIVDIQGGVAPYTIEYEIFCEQFSVETENESNLLDGFYPETYTIRVTDFFGCSQECTIEIN
ncbi:MAG: hypothetical protein AAF705_00525, partial [Bacteroidota bacterium]